MGDSWEYKLFLRGSHSFWVSLGWTLDLRAEIPRVCSLLGFTFKGGKWDDSFLTSSVDDIKSGFVSFFSVYASDAFWLRFLTIF